MKKILQHCQVRLENYGTSASLLFIRIVLAFVFIPAGWGKLNNLERTTGFFEYLGIPFPALQAPLVAGVEFLGGLLLLLGLASRWASIPLAFIMIVAIATAHWGDMDSAWDLLSMADFLYIAMFTVLITRGSGALSVDHFASKKWEILK